MSSFTVPHRKKRITTYGKSSRTAAPAFNILDEPVAPQRPRKELGGAHKSNDATGKRATTAAPQLAFTSDAGTSRTNLFPRTASRDESDVPSTSDELASPPGTASHKRSSSKPMAEKDVWDVPSSDDESTTGRPLGKTARLGQKPSNGRPQPTPLKSVRIAKELASGVAFKDTRPLKKPEKPIAKSVPEPVPAKPKTSVPSKRSYVKPSPASRATAPATASYPHKRNKSASTGQPTSNVIEKAPSKLDIYDVPPSDGESTAKPPRRKIKPPPLRREKTPVVSKSKSSLTSPAQRGDSDASSSSLKRKRAATAQSSDYGDEGTASKGSSATPQRSSKHRKKEDIGSKDGVAVVIQVQSQRPVPDPSLWEAKINKPRRTRARTIPVPLRPPSPKERSGDLPVENSFQPIESVMAADDTMYEISDPTTPRRPSEPFVAPSGSITPRQKEMFGNLLDGQVETPGILNLGKLQLTAKKPASNPLPMAKPKTSSTPAVSARKPKLVDTLIRAAPSLDDDDSTSETEESMEDSSVEILPAAQSKAKKSYGRSRTVVSGGWDEMELDLDVAAGSQLSQPSQNSVLLQGGSRITYAKQRSYLGEDNAENELLMSIPTDMDLSTPRFGKQKRQMTPSDEEEDGAGKVRPYHELRKQGQDYRFKFETQALLDDIADRNKSGKSRRRASMMEICKSMMDDQFINQLYDTALEEQLLKNWGSTGEIIFDFAVAGAVARIVKYRLDYPDLDQVYRSPALHTLLLLLDFDQDIDRIAKERSTNLSRIGREEVAAFRKLVVACLWPAEDQRPAKVSPRIVAMKTLESLILGLRQSGCTEALLEEEATLKLIDIATVPCDRLRSGCASAADHEDLNLAFSIMEAVSCSKDHQTTWSNKCLCLLADMIPVFFEAQGASPIKLAIRLTMNLTNNKPNACEVFAGPGFIQPLVESINVRFSRLSGTLSEEERTDTLECVILSLGAMINLAEFSDRARASVCEDGDTLINALVDTFLDGLERAAQANSMEESQSNVATGYLTVLLGNLCLNSAVRTRVRARLPSQRIDVLVNAVQEFIHYNEKVDRDLRETFDGEEGQETWANFTRRLMTVVERLRDAAD